MKKKPDRTNVTLRMSAELWFALKLVSDATDKTRSDIVEEAVRSYPWLQEQIDVLETELTDRARKARQAFS